MRAKIAGPGRVRRTRRRNAPLRDLRRWSRDHRLPAALEHRPLARLQGAVALFQRTLPLHRLSTAAATANPIGRRMWRLTRWTTTWPMRLRSWMRPMRARLSSFGLSFAGMLACILAAHHPERVKAAILAGTSASIGPSYPYMHSRTHFLREARAVRGLGQIQPRLLAFELSRFCRIFRSQYLFRTALDQADRGWRRLGGRHHRPGAGQDGGSADDPAGV